MSIAMTTNEPATLDETNTSHFVTVDGIRIHYNVVKSPSASRTPVIFTHGGGPGSTSWNNFLYNAQAFSQRYTCYFYDLPGFGDSDCVPVRGPVHSWHAEKFLKFLDALNIDRVHLVNQSFGGSMAIKVASMAADRVDHLVITGSRPVLGGLQTPISMTRSRQAVQNYYFGKDSPSPESMRSLIAELEFYQTDKITDLNVQSRYKVSIDPRLRAFMSDPANRGEPESLVEQFRNVKARTLIVHGLHDAFGGVDVPLFMVNQFADARLHLVGNAAHHVQTECPAEYNAVVLNFLP
jgi:2-hydroxy-6-oxonona-2,4-dienedioate hydrolase